MLLCIERAGIQESADRAPSWDHEGQKFSYGVRQDCQEHNGNVNDLGFEIEDLLEDSSKGGKSDAYNRCQLLDPTKTKVSAVRDHNFE
jgi:hypothetical protein